MRQAILFLSLVGALSSAAQSDQLVINGGFEMLNGEPKTYDQITQATGWRNVTIGYSELFSKTAPAKTVGLPDNDYGHIDPKEGEYCAGFFAWKDDMKRSVGGDDDFENGWNAYSEYIIAELKQSLVEGKEYEVSFWLALSGNSDRAVMGMGAYFGPEPIKYDHRRFLEHKPQVSVDAILEKKGEWVELKGTFVADGEERYITIGTFPAAGFDSKKLVEGLDNQYAYYYVDDIRVRLFVPE